MAKVTYISKENFIKKLNQINMERIRLRSLAKNPKKCRKYPLTTVERIAATLIGLLYKEAVLRDKHDCWWGAFRKEDKRAVAEAMRPIIETVNAYVDRKSAGYAEAFQIAMHTGVTIVSHSGLRPLEVTQWGDSSWFLPTLAPEEDR